MDESGYSSVQTASFEEKPKKRGGLVIILIITILLVMGGLIFWIYTELNNSATLENSDLLESGFNSEIQNNLKALGLENEKNLISFTTSGFNPSIITIKSGEQVVWINEDVIVRSASYSINTSDGSSYSSTGPLDSNFVMSMSEYETVEYSDDINPDLKVKIIVE